MIIDVKGARSTEAENPAGRYVLKYDPMRSKLPLVIGIGLAGALSYLRSTASTVEAAAPEPERAPVPHEDHAPAPDEAVASAPAASEASSRGPAGADPAPEAGAVRTALEAESSLRLRSGPIPVADLPTSGPMRLLPMPAGGSAGDGAGSPGGSGVGPAAPPSGTGGKGPGRPSAGPGGGTGGGLPVEDPRANRAPRVTGPVSLPDVALGAVLLIGLDELLRGATDPDGDALTVKYISASGGNLVASGAGWLFRPGPDELGPVKITYLVSDGAFSVLQSAHLNVIRPRIEGGAGDDLLIGTPFSDEISGGDGDDRVDARAGDDVVNGGAGDDHIVAGDGHDVVYAGPGHDIVFGGPGNDRLFGGAGNDRLFGGDGDDVLHGEDGADELSGGAGSDVLFGGTGNDVLLGGAGRDVVFGGEGDDRVLADLDAVSDVFDGGAGHDVIDYSAATARVTIDLAAGRGWGVEVGEDSLSGFETAIGGAGDDVFVADTSPTVFVGGAGANRFEYLAASGDPTSVHEIVDFKYGDTIRVSKWDVFERMVDALEDRFRKVYGDDDREDLPIRYRHEDWQDSVRTMIEADLDHDQEFETIVSIHGQHYLTFIETC